jgi:vacuolar-type H+-ATPase subunit H
MSKKFVGVQFIETVREGDKTFAFGIYADHVIGRIPFCGLAERNPTDKENHKRGRNFAIGRALENAGKEVQKAEWKKIKSKSKATIKHKLSEEAIDELRKEANKNRAKASKQANQENSEISPRTGKPKRQYTRKAQSTEV